MSDKLTEFTGKLVDEILVAGEDWTATFSLSRRELIKLLRPIAKRFQNLDRRLTEAVEHIQELERIHPEPHEIVRKKRSWFRFRLGGRKR